jgi:hypothetical protein
MKNEKAAINGKILRFTKWSGARKVKCTCGSKIKVGEEYDILYIAPDAEHKRGDTVGPLHTYCLDRWLWVTNLEREGTPEDEALREEPDRIDQPEQE